MLYKLNLQNWKEKKNAIEKKQIVIFVRSKLIFLLHGRLALSLFRWTKNSIAIDMKCIVVKGKLINYIIYKNTLQRKFKKKENMAAGLVKGEMLTFPFLIYKNTLQRKFENLRKE